MEVYLHLMIIQAQLKNQFPVKNRHEPRLKWQEAGQGAVFCIFFRLKCLQESRVHLDFTGTQLVPLTAALNNSFHVELPHSPAISPVSHFSSSISKKFF
jgi:hypothetical protein